MKGLICMENIILEKLKNIENRQERTNNDIESIKNSLIQVAEQKIEIKTILENQSALWLKADKHAEKINQIKNFQAGCQSESIQKTIDRQDFMLKSQWAVISLTIAILGFIVAFNKIGG